MKKKWKFVKRAWAWKDKKTGEVDWESGDIAKTKQDAEKYCGDDERVVRVKLEVREI